MQRVLITGAAGFVGANLLRTLLNKHPQTKIYLILRPTTNTWRIKDLLKKVKIIHSDLSDLYDLQKQLGKIKPDVIFHLAAYGAYSRDSDLIKAVQTNIVGLNNLLGALEKVDYKLFVNTGSSSEYGYKSKPMKETDLLEPNSNYSATKGAATLIASMYGKIKNKPIVTLRLFSVYGPYEEPGRFIPTVCLKAINNQQIDVVAQSSRDFVYIDDVVDAYLKCLSLKKTHLRGVIFNICSARQTTIIKAARSIKKIAKSSSPIVIGSYSPRPWDTATWVGNNQLARKVLHWTPRNSLEQGLSKSLEWFRINADHYEQTPEA